MFICHQTGKVSAPRESQIRVVIETRPKTYVNRFRDVEGNAMRNESRGFETVKEVAMTREGFAIWQRETLEKLGHVSISPPGKG